MAISKTLVASALSGMVFASLSIGCGATPAAGAPGVKDPTGAAKACCKGMNECKGKGGCKGGGNCGGKNECKGKGGCNGSCPKALTPHPRVGRVGRVPLFRSEPGRLRFISPLATYRRS